MRTTEKRMISKESTISVSLVCDICGKRAPCADDWTIEPYETLDTTIEFDEGTCYPEERSGERISADICPECFKTKLIPWIESFGHVKLTPKEYWY